MGTKLKRLYKSLRNGRTAVIGIPYLWLLVFLRCRF